MNTQHLRELADVVNGVDCCEPGVTNRLEEAADALRSCADRIDATLTPSVVDKAIAAFVGEGPLILKASIAEHRMHAALQSVWPVSSEDAKRADEIERAVASKYFFFKERYGAGNHTTLALSQLLDTIAAMTTKRAQKKDPEFAAYVRAMKKETSYTDSEILFRWGTMSGIIFRAGVAFGLRSKGK